MAAIGLRPQDAGFGLELSSQEWDSIIRGPLVAASAVLSLDNVNVHDISGPLHLPTMDVPLDADTAFLAAGEEITPTQATTNEVVLMPRELKALKCIVLISNESVRSEAGSALGAAQEIITERLRQIVDVALLAGNSGAGITGLIPLAGTTIDASDVVLYPVDTRGLDVFTDALTASLDASASPDTWIINTQTLGKVLKMKDSLGRPLLQPNPTMATSDMLLGRAVVPTPNAPVGTCTLIDSSQVHVAMDVDGNALILNERYAEFDSIGLRIVSRFDIQVINKPGVVVVHNIT